MSYSLGVVQTISAMVKLFTPEGGSVLIQTPVYSEFYDMAEAWNRKVLENRFQEHDGVWQVDWEDFEAKLQEADLFLLCNPHNPLGIVWEEADLRRMMELCLKHHVLVVSDEIHSDLIFHGKKHIPTATLSPEIAANVVTGISGTKTFNLAGLQASTVVFPDAHKKQVFDHYWQCMDIHRNNAFSLTAMETAFTQGEEWLEQLLPYLSANFDFVVDYCRVHIPQIKTYAPDATYLMWLDCRELGLSNQELHDFMIQKAKLGLNDGCSFDRQLSGFMRLNAACPGPRWKRPWPSWRPQSRPCNPLPEGSVVPFFRDPVNKSRPFPKRERAAFFSLSAFVLQQMRCRTVWDRRRRFQNCGVQIKKKGRENSRPFRLLKGIFVCGPDTGPHRSAL